MSQTNPERTPIDCEAWRATLVERIEVARAGRDPEGVHGLRVACARLDVFLRLARWRVLRPDLRWLRRAASPTRDLDVLLASDLSREMRAALELQRGRAREELLAAFDHERAIALLQALEHAPVLNPARALEAYDKLRQRVAERGEALHASASALGDFHALRRALRRLRYAREWLGLDSAPLRALQDLLGALNDAVVEQHWLETTLASHANAQQRSELEQRIRTLRAAALDTWRATRHRILESPA